MPLTAIAQPGSLPPEPEPEVYTDLVAILPKEVNPSLFCNCYQFIKQTYLPDLPQTATILSDIKATGTVAVFYYASSGLHHYAYVKSETETTILVEEANFYSCQHSYRQVDKNDKSLLGYY